MRKNVFIKTLFFCLLLLLILVVHVLPFLFNLINDIQKQPEKIKNNVEIKTDRIPKVQNIITNENKNYFKRYPFLSKCEIEYTSKTKDDEPIEPELYEKRITRAVLFYCPTRNNDNFMKEIRWVYRSWIEMQKYEPAKWRTDLIVFLDNRESNEKYKKFEEINCSFKHVRKSNKDKPMCCLVPHVPIKERNNSYDTMKFASIDDEYKHLYEKIDIFNYKEEDLNPFYAKLLTFKNYGYIDSILMAFEGYNYLKDKYQYLVRSDMDIFLTPLFSKWLPKTCNDFVVGGGGYSNDFNVKKLHRIATHLQMSYIGERNLGSTWYASPAQFCLVSYLTLVSMAYISNEEFTSVEREGKIGGLNWPEWHYGVLLLYGQNIALNHLAGSNQTKVIRYADLIDFGSGNERDIAKSVHIHVYHGDNIFSKFRFYDGKYDNETVAVENRNKTKYYCLYIALESKRLNGSALIDLANVEGNKKT